LRKEKMPEEKVLQLMSFGCDGRFKKHIMATMPTLVTGHHLLVALKEREIQT
jgi:hypothetical protein